MPTYLHVCQNEECNHEWEDYYSLSQAPPTSCPVCLKETAKRVIAGGGTRGVVTLYGQDLTDKITADAQQLKKDMTKNEKIYANMLGETKYEALQTQMDKQKRGKY